MISPDAACAHVTSVIERPLELPARVRGQVRAIVRDQYALFADRAAATSDVRLRRVPIRLAASETFRFAAHALDFIDADGGLEPAQELNRRLDELDAVTDLDAAFAGIRALLADIPALAGG